MGTVFRVCLIYSEYCIKGHREIINNKVNEFPINNYK